jgi:hypothetical protein
MRSPMRGSRERLREACCPAPRAVDVGSALWYTYSGGGKHLFAGEEMDESVAPSHRNVAIPQSVLITARSLDDLEDWLAAHDPAFLSEIHRIRSDEDLADSGKDIAEVLKRWPIES